MKVRQMMFSRVLKIDGFFDDYLRIIMQKQLLDTELWQKCVNVFSSGIDDNDRGWRGEYWGKMMRGACLVYSVTRSPELYGTLTQAVKGLLEKQEKSGRISSYSVENEFFGWDIWARKYVMTGLQHYLDICDDPAFSQRIMKALVAHADYITEHIGEGKINILDTGLYWGSVNSASILEPFVRLYADTKNTGYLDFAEYIIKSGGCAQGNLIHCVNEGKAPFEFPETKAYETMSFFEGLLAYYEVTGKKEYLDCVIKFTDSVLKTDYTAIGSCGCTHELFDNSTVKQTEPSDKIMQETCVTVTLMRLLTRLFNVTGGKKYINAFRKSALNALSGALNINGYEQYGMEKKVFLPGMVFDSYSPVCDGSRARGIGGFKQFANGSYFGCCACIASAGFALYPLMCVTEKGGTISVNYIECGEYETSVGDNTVRISVSPGKIKITAPEDLRFTLKLTGGDNYTRITAGKEKDIAGEGGYYIFNSIGNGDSIEFVTEPLFKEETINGKSTFNFGGYALAADTAKTPAYKPGEKIMFTRDENGAVTYEALSPHEGEQIRISVNTEKGNLILTDYAAAGQDGKSLVTVWF
ncbi:MAG: glycoside hydrolase family 127 protein [Clostridiales bacterium]|nr:glycoside hydrolase family 127 protein [Clostridiales bacterium]